LTQLSSQLRLGNPSRRCLRNQWCFRITKRSLFRKSKAKITPEHPPRHTQGPKIVVVSNQTRTWKSLVSQTQNGTRLISNRSISKKRRMLLISFSNFLHLTSSADSSEMYLKPSQRRRRSSLEWRWHRSSEWLPRASWKRT
jgi:hypothetical protein